jgi:hypothetical protein
MFRATLDPGDELLGDAIAETEREIFDDAMGNYNQDDRDTNRRIVGFNSRTQNSNDDFVDDSIMLRAHMGEFSFDDIESGNAPLTSREDALMNRVVELEEENEGLQQFRPEPERPDQFSDPEAWEANILAQHRGGGIPLNHGPSPVPKPDMFADPEGYERWMLGEMDRRAGNSEFATQRLNASLGAAHQIHGESFETAWNDVTSMDHRDPRAREAVAKIVSAADPGAMLMQVHGALRGAGEAAQRYGGPHFAPMFPGTRAPSAYAQHRGRPTTREEADEAAIFDSIWE